MAQYPTNNIFVDTSIFIKNSHGTNRKIEQLATLAKKGIIKIYLSKIIIGEIENKIKEDLLQAKSKPLQATKSW